MMKRTKRMIFVQALAIVMIGAGLYGASKIYAQDNQLQLSLVQQIATKFNLKTEDVQSVFDQVRQTRQAEGQARYEQLLTDAVAKGELTEAKKQLLIAKRQELIADREKRKSELTTWAINNDIDIKYLMQGFGKGRMRMHGRKDY